MKRLLYRLVVICILCACSVDYTRHEYHKLDDSLSIEILRLVNEALPQDSYKRYEPKVEIRDNAVIVYLQSSSYPSMLIYEKENGTFFYYYFMYDVKHDYWLDGSKEIAYDWRTVTLYSSDKEEAKKHASIPERVELVDVVSKKTYAYDPATKEFQIRDSFVKSHEIDAIKTYANYQAIRLNESQVNTLVELIKERILATTEMTTDIPADELYSDDEMYTYKVVDFDDINAIPSSSEYIGYSYECMSCGSYSPGHLKQGDTYALTYFYDIDAQHSMENYFVFVDWMESKETMGPNIVVDTSPIIYDETTNTANVHCFDYDGNDIGCTLNLEKTTDFTGILHIEAIDDLQHKIRLDVEIQLDKPVIIYTGVYEKNDGTIYKIYSNRFVEVQNGTYLGSYVLSHTYGNAYALDYIRDDGPSDLIFFESDGVYLESYNEERQQLKRLGDIDEME